MTQTAQTLTVSEAANRIGVSRQTARRMALSGALPGSYALPSGHVRVPAAAVEAFLDRGRRALAERGGAAA